MVKAVGWRIHEGGGGVKRIFLSKRVYPDHFPAVRLITPLLLVTEQYGQGRTAVFTGFTPEYAERRAGWDARIEFPYPVDQEFYTNPVSTAYFALFMRMLAAATGQQPATPYDEVLAARDKPLFETLQDSPCTALRTPGALNAKASGGKASASLDVVNGQQYVRLVRLRVEWNEPES